MSKVFPGILVWLLLPRLQAAGLPGIDAKALERILHSLPSAGNGGRFPTR